MDLFSKSGRRDGRGVRTSSSVSPRGEHLTASDYMNPDGSYSDFDQFLGGLKDDFTPPSETESRCLRASL